MKTTLYSVYLLALNGRLALPSEETNERYLLAHYYGRNIATHGFMTKEKLYIEVKNTLKVNRKDGKTILPVPRYKIGYQLKFKDGQVHTIKSVTFNDGEYIYHCNLNHFTETYLKDNVYLVFESEEARKEQEQPKLEEFGKNGHSFDLKNGLQYKILEVKYNEDRKDYIYRVVNRENAAENFFWQEYLKKNLKHFW